MDPGLVAVALAAAALGSALSLVSGFGLGTLLLPAFALIVPLDIAVAATAVVHLVNNLAKGTVLGRHADGLVVLRFGIPAMLAAFFGAAVLVALEPATLSSYDLGGPRNITVLGLVVGALITLFAVVELVPRLRDLQVAPRFLVAGGALSGFFGGLSGHQGAMRSVFLGRLGLTTAGFVATATVCGLLVDVARLVVYGVGYGRGLTGMDADGWRLVAGCVLLAVVVAILGARLVVKLESRTVRLFVGAALLLLGPAIALGLL